MLPLNSEKHSNKGAQASNDQSEFDALTSSPRRVPSGAEQPSPEFSASVADVTDEQHQNMAGLVQADDFNAEAIVRFCARTESRHASTSRPAASATRPPFLSARRMCASRAFACARRSATRWKPPSGASRRSDDYEVFATTSSERVQRAPQSRAGRGASARIFRLRIERGYSVYELGIQAGVLACIIERLESGKPADKRVLPALASALGVPLCRLVCGEHSCAERACVARLAVP